MARLPSEEDIERAIATVNNRYAAPEYRRYQINKDRIDIRWRDTTVEIHLGSTAQAYDLALAIDGNRSYGCHFAYIDGMKSLWYGLNNEDRPEGAF